MTTRRRRKCPCCGELFVADARNRGRQKYCSKPTCRCAGKAARQRRWLAKPENQNYFRGALHVARVRAWRQAHPGYWRQSRPMSEPALQDACRVQLAEVLKDSATLALQDVCRRQDAVLIGLIAHLSDSALQDDIAAAGRRLLQLGQDILCGGTTNAHQTGAAP